MSQILGVGALEIKIETKICETLTAVVVVL